MIALLISFLIAGALAIVLHGSTRRFVRNRLRYVDSVQKAFAPWAAGAAVFFAAALVVGFIPFIGLGTALTAALAVGSGVSAGARDIRNGSYPIVFGA